MIGTGTYGTVKKARALDTGNDVAVKIILKKTVKGHEDMVEKEIGVLKNLSHPNIVNFLDWWVVRCFILCLLPHCSLILYFYFCFIRGRQAKRNKGRKTKWLFIVLQRKKEHWSVPFLFFLFFLWALLLLSINPFDPRPEAEQGHCHCPLVLTDRYDMD